MQVTDQDEPTVTIKASDLAKFLGVTRGYLSRAAHNDWQAGGSPVAEWATWNRTNSQVLEYEVPVPDARDIIPPSEKRDYRLY